jgi:hypothetical protein
MQMLERAILALYLAHLLSEFIFQTAHIVQQKKQNKPAGYCAHGAVIYVISVLLTGLCIPGTFVSPRLYIVILGLTLIHLLIDFGRIYSSGVMKSFDGIYGFISDQLLHLITVIVAGWIIVRVPSAMEWEASVYALARPSDRTLLLLVVCVAVIFGGGFLIRALTAPLMEGVHAGESKAKLRNAGMYIGWLERFLALTALPLHSPATVGLIMAAKSIARYPEFKNEQFAEYFLIGTLLSICLALLGGVILLKVFYGTISLQQ